MRTARLLENIFILVTAIGAFLFLMGLSGLHGHFSFHANRLEFWFFFGTLPIGVIGLAVTSARKMKFSSPEFISMVAESPTFQELLITLAEATAILEISGVKKPFRFTSKEEFVQKLRTVTADLREHKFDDLDDLWRWFSPGDEWDSFTGADGADVGGRLFVLIDQIRTTIG